MEPFPRKGARPRTQLAPAPRSPLYRAVLRDADLSELQSLYSSTTARPTHKSFPANHSARAASDRFSDALASLRMRGVPIALLASSLDPPLSHQAVRERIGTARASSPAPLSAQPAQAPLSAQPVPDVMLSDVPGRTRRVRMSPAPAPAPALPVLTTARDLVDWLSLPRRRPPSVLTVRALADEHLTPAIPREH